jgi:hypothetical protein
MAVPQSSSLHVRSSRLRDRNSDVRRTMLEGQRQTRADKSSCCIAVDHTATNLPIVSKAQRLLCTGCWFEWFSNDLTPLQRFEASKNCPLGGRHDRRGQFWGQNAALLHSFFRRVRILPTFTSEFCLPSSCALPAQQCPLCISATVQSAAGTAYC